MRVTQIKSSNTLLTYSLLTSPDPLQVSPSTGPPSIGALTFVISCPTAIGQVAVKQIAFNLPVGSPTKPDATDLTEVSTGISPSVTSSNASQWKIGPGGIAGSFVLVPAPGNPGTINSQGLSVTLTGIQISPIVGTAEITIAEMATANTDPPQPRTCTIVVPKFPYGFVAGNLTAASPMVNNGSTVSLTWVGSPGPTYTMLWGTGSHDVSTVNQWTSPPLTDVTTFILEVIAQQNGQTATLYFSVTVIVADPNIVATSLAVLNGATVGANLQVTGAISGIGMVYCAMDHRYRAVRTAPCSL
jgi:hypothetical protein